MGFLGHSGKEVLPLKEQCEPSVDQCQNEIWNIAGIKEVIFNINVYKQ